jgi:2-succinyl-5-enolpyruvyl-6-hydroxy-3-cyclohexene-1-carboxylate synthase
MKGSEIIKDFEKKLKEKALSIANEELEKQIILSGGERLLEKEVKTWIQTTKHLLTRHQA